LIIVALKNTRQCTQRSTHIISQSSRCKKLQQNAIREKWDKKGKICAPLPEMMFTKKAFAN
jgi:hypothetical protein